MTEPAPDPGPRFRQEQVQIAERSRWRKLPAIAAVVGIGALAAGWSLKDGNAPKFWSSYMTALMFFLSLSLGGLFFTLVQHATRAGWSVVCRRIAENMMLTLPVMAVAALAVVVLGGHDLFHWLHEGVVEGDPVLLAKRPYLNERAFVARALTYTAVWSVLSLAFYLWSTRQDSASDPKPFAHRMRGFAPLSLLLFAATLTFAAFDWLMSLDPHWFSTIFGVYYFSGLVVSTHAVIAIVAILLHRTGYLRGVITKEHFHDLGKWMFAFTVFWAYIGFSQYFLIWYASIPEETQWFSYRGHGDFLDLSIVLVFARFVLPFLGLMSRRIKRNPTALMFWALWVVVAQFLDMYWLVQPALAHQTGAEQIFADAHDVLTFLGLGGVWVAVFTWGLVRAALVPLKDPRLEESITFENA